MQQLKTPGAGDRALLIAPNGLWAWARLLRPHQWAKNILVFVPLLTAHLFTPAAFAASLAAFGAFCLCASGTYIINDWLDIEADRGHPSKRLRPLASGAIAPLPAVLLAVPLIGLAFAVALSLSRDFLIVLVLYLVLTVSYSLLLKRKLFVDVILLGLLYTGRVIAGAVAIHVTTSEWLLSFSGFLFLFLALTKRYSEMALRFDLGLPDPENRAYRSDDLPILASLAAASGFSAVIVFSLYLASDMVRELYRQPRLLWLACPILLYWIGRMLMLSHRRRIDDDPVIFALRDRAGLISIGLILLLAAIAI